MQRVARSHQRKHHLLKPGKISMDNAAFASMHRNTDTVQVWQPARDCRWENDLLRTNMAHNAGKEGEAKAWIAAAVALLTKQGLQSVRKLRPFS